MRITVIGLGPLGGSLAGVCRSRGLADEVVGCDVDAANLELARNLGLIDRAEAEPMRAVLGAKVVLVAVPVYRVFTLVTGIAENLRPDALLLDVAGTSRRIGQQIAREQPAGGRLVAGFPLVNLTGSGAGASRPDLMAGVEVLLADPGERAAGELDRAGQFWSKLGLVPRPLAVPVFEKAVVMCATFPGVVLDILKEVVDKYDVPIDYKKSYLGSVLAHGGGDADVSERSRQLRAGQLIEQLRLLIAGLERELRSLGGEPANREGDDG